MTSARTGSNPYSTGGGGVSFEQRVGAIYLTSLLAQHVPYGLDGITKEIKFQQIRTESLDDLIIISKIGNTERKLSLQLKHNMRFTASDTNFTNAIQDCWKTLKKENIAKFDPEIDRFGVGIGISQRIVGEHIVPIINIARRNNAQGFTQARKSFSIKKKKFLNLLETKITDVKGELPTEEELWTFLRCFEIIHFDLEHDESKDVILSWNILLDLLSDRDAATAKSLAEHLFSIVSAYNPSGGAITYQQLKDQCLNFPIVTNPDFNNDIKQLRLLADTALNLVRDVIGEDICFDRNAELDQIKNKLSEKEIVVIHGEPLIGKSVLMKKLANEYQSDGEFVWFSIDMMENNSLQSYLHQHGIENNFNDILNSFQNIPKKCIFLDGLEQTTQENKRRVVNEILLAVKTYNQKIKSLGGAISQYWKVLISSRSPELEKILFNLHISNQTLEKFSLNGLTKIEKNKIIDKKPSLNEIIQNPNLQELFSRPGAVDLACYSNFPTEDNTIIKEINSESQFMTVFWEHVICRDNGLVSGRGSPLERKRLVLAIAKESLVHDSRYTTEQCDDSEALTGLKLDGIIQINHNGVLFLYDYLEDWAWAFFFKSNFEEVFDKIQSKHNSLRIITALGLYSQLILDVEKDLQKWMACLKFLKSENYSPRWADEWVSAIVLSPNSEKILENFSEMLLSNENELFTTILRILRLKAVTYDLKFLSLSENSDAIRYLPQFAIPIPEKWKFILDFLIKNFLKIKGHSLFEFSRFAVLWAKKMKGDTFYKKELCRICFELAEHYLSYSTERNEKRQINYDQKNEFRKNLLAVIFNSADVLPQKVDEFIRKHTVFRTDDFSSIDKEFLTDGCDPILKELPDTFLDAMSYMLCEKLTLDTFGYDSFDTLGIDYDSEWFYPSSDLHPFYPFLKLHPEHGLALIEKIVNHSTDAWKIREIKEEPVTQTMRLDDKDLQFWGDELVFRWYRFPSLGSNAVNCALLALERWINEQIKGGVDPNPILKRLLINTSSVAIVGLICSIALANHNKISRNILVSILENPVYWLFDTLRHSFDSYRAESLLNSRLYIMSDVSFLKKIAKQPHRQMTITNLVPLILVSNDENLKERLTEAIKSFEKDNPVVYKNPHQFSIESRLSLNRDKIKKECRIWALHADLDNWRKAEQNEGTGYYFYQPDHFNEEDQRDMDVAQEHTTLSLYRQLAYELLTRGKMRENVSNNQMLEYARKLIPELPDKEQPAGLLAVDFIVTFAAALIVRNPDFINKEKLRNWCESIILDGANIQTHESQMELNPWAFNRGVAYCLPFMYKQHKNNNIRKALDKFALHYVDEVRHTFYINLQELWNFESKLIWKYVGSLIKQFANTRNMTTCDPRFTNSSMLSSILLVIPKNQKLKENSDYKKIIKLISDLLTFTINCYLEGQEKNRNYNEWYPNVWNGMFFSLYANAIILDEKLQQETTPKIFSEWIEVPSLMEEFLRQLVLTLFRNKFDEQSFALWENICNKIIDSQQFFPSSYRDHTKEISGLLIFYDPLLNVSWKSENNIFLTRHVQFIQKWCEKFKNNSQGFAVLTQFLNSNGAIFSYDYKINWLMVMINDVSDKQDFLKKSKISSELDHMLWTIWEKHEEQMKQNNEVFRKFSLLVDITAKYEKPYSIRLQTILKNK